MADLGMKQFFASIQASLDFVTRPPLAKFAAALVEFIYQSGKPGIAWSVAAAQTELGQCSLGDSFPIDCTLAKILIGENERDDIALLWGQRLKISNDLACRAIPGEQIPAPTSDVGRVRPHLFQEAQKQRADRFLGVG